MQFVKLGLLHTESSGQEAGKAKEGCRYTVSLRLPFKLLWLIPPHLSCRLLTGSEESVKSLTLEKPLPWHSGRTAQPL